MLAAISASVDLRLPVGAGQVGRLDHGAHLAVALAHGAVAGRALLAPGEVDELRDVAARGRAASPRRAATCGAAARQPCRRRSSGGRPGVHSLSESADGARSQAGGGEECEERERDAATPARRRRQGRRDKEGPRPHACRELTGLAAAWPSCRTAAVTLDSDVGVDWRPPRPGEGLNADRDPEESCTAAETDEAPPRRRRR